MPNPRSEAEELVFENLQETDLNVDNNDLDTDDDDQDQSQQQTQDDDSSSDDDQQLDTNEDEQRPRLNDLRPRVSHTEQQNRQQQQQPRPVGQFKADAKGNIVAQDGKVVARAGREARLFTQAHNDRRAAQLAKTEMTQMETRLQRAIQIGKDIHAELEQLKNEKQQLHNAGLTPQELMQAASNYRDYKTDPISFAKKLLTRIAADGKDITQLGMQPGGGLDPAALLGIIRQELAQYTKPLADQRAREADEDKRKREDTEAQERVNRQVSTFFINNPDAEPYVPVFEQALQKFPDMSLGEIWARIQLNLLRNGTPQQRSNRGNSPRLPVNGRHGGPVDNRRQRPAQMASPDESYDKIIGEVLNASM